jgi:predicted lysophospholipase L1 biosynthesis ABC-type transport system permease subunit
MPSPLIDTPEALDAAIATAVQTRRERLLRVAGGKGIRIRVAYACTGFVALCGVAAYLAGDRLAAIILVLEACVLFGMVSFVTQAARSRARRELQEMS